MVQAYPKISVLCEQVVLAFGKQLASLEFTGQQKDDFPLLLQ
jgi:hypothetical protein